MVRQVTKFVANDGTIFDSESAAELHEKTAELQKEISNHLYQCTAVSFSEAEECSATLIRNFNISRKGS